MIAGPRSSTRTIPASTRMFGPVLGYRPEVDGAAFSTATGAGGHEGVRGHTVDVDVVDHRDVAVVQPGRELLGARSDPGRAVRGGRV